MKMIKSEMKHSGPKEVVSSVSIKVGGVLKAAAPGELPRGERQVINAKRTLRFKSEDVDELFVVMQKAKAEDTYVRDIKTSPDPAIVIASDRQLDDLVRFCAPPAGIESCIMTVDPTFSLGEFECTPVTYRQLLVQTRRGKVSPVFLGPILIHYRKNFPTFLHFAASLVSLRKELQCIRVFGTDGEKALVDAFSHEFRFSIHLYCSIHVRNNVKKNLRERKFTEEKVNKITDEIFGKKIGSTYCEGLVDAGSEEVFYQQLEDKQLHWEELEKECPGCIPGFFDWFKEHLYEVIISGMLRPLREDAGLGVPPSAFSTNASESVNAMLKRKVDYKKNELPNFIQHLKEVIDEQQREIERAVIRRGKYEFKEEYRFLEVDESKWFQMTKQQREKHMKKVADTSLKGYELDVCTESKPSSLSITAEECHSGDHKVPLASIQGIWKKAEELLAQPNAVVTAPGFDASVKMVASKSGKRPHLVKSGKGGRVSCDSDCPNWRSLNICSHTVAVAETNNCLPQYIDFYRKSKHLPSITQLVLTGLPTGIGKKGNRISRKRKNTEVTDRIPVSTASSVPSTIATSHSRVGFSTNTHLVITTTTDSDSTPAIPSVSPVCYQFNRPDIHSPLSDTSYIPTPLSGTPYIPTPYFPFAMQPHQPLMNFNNRGGGNIRVHSATQCITPPPYWPAGQTNWPSDQSDADVDPSAKFRLCFRTGNISVCNGCRNKFDKKAAPPNDLCVQHAEWRTYTSPVTSQPESRYGNAYYHANPSCIIHKWPHFIQEH